MGPSFNGRTVHLQCTDRGSIPLGSTRFLFFYIFVRVSEETQYGKKPTWWNINDILMLGIRVNFGMPDNHLGLAPNVGYRLSRLS